MAFIDFTDAAGKTLRYELPAEEGALMTLGAAAEATLHVEGEGVAAQHATVSLAEGQYAITPAEGAVLVNGAPIETPTLLVEGVDYAIGSLHLAFSAAAPAKTPAKAPAKAAAAKAPAGKKAVQRKKAPAAAAAVAAAAAAPKQNPAVTVLIPLYSVAVVAAAFVAGLTLRYWILTGGFLPADWLNK